LMRDLRRGGVAFLMSSLLVAAAAQTQPAYPDWVPQTKIEYSPKNLADFYGNISSAVNCRRPANEGEAMICSSDYLTNAELLNTRASAYAI
jgi:hypothetical protein